MKKIFFSLMAMALVALVGCNDFDDPTSQNFGEGPEIAIDVDQAFIADSTFTFTVTPAPGSMFYTILIDESSTVEELNPETLLKDQYSALTSFVLNAQEEATFTYNMREGGAPIGKPNTDYVIYAVAANDKGVVGNITTAKVHTTDGKSPVPTQAANDPDNGIVQILFSEGVKQGAGKVSAKYYGIYSGVMYDVPEEDITVSIENDVVTFNLANIPGSAYTFVSWEQGAFVDAVGNNCTAMSSGISAAGRLQGVYFRKSEEPFAIQAEITPADGSSIDNWKAPFVFKFNKPVYKEEDEYLTGEEIIITYLTGKKETDYLLENDSWAVSEDGLTLTVNLEEAPESGNLIYITLSEGAVFDEFGNANKEFTTSKGWNYSEHLMPVEDVYGIYEYSFPSYGIGQTLNGKIVISPSEEEEGMLALYGFGTEYAGILDDFANAEFYDILGAFDGAKQTITVPAMTYPTVLMPDADAFLLLCDNDDYQNDIVFTLDGEGNMVSNLGWLRGTLSTYTLTGWFDYGTDVTTFKKVGNLNDASAKKIVKAAKKSTIKKSSKKVASKKVSKKAVKPFKK